MHTFSRKFLHLK
uniref:Uncharacterized protein n=1 Tax=Arundo donax TaxID=35708 RepID=A0A0A9EL17_ARUDO